MPWSTREVVVLGVLLMCVPAQYWIMNQWGHSDGNRPQRALARLGKEIQKFQWLWFETLDWWKRWYFQFLTSVRRTIAGGKVREMPEECPAKEVALYRERTGYFGLSPLERPHRPGYISYRVGQVVKLIDHEQQGALGVIIAWDLYARELRKEPHYRVLLSRPLIREIYVAQRNIKVLRSTQINHPRVAEIFSHFDGAQYIPREPLRQLYPLD